VHEGWAVALILFTFAWMAVPLVIQTVLAPKSRGNIGSESTSYGLLASLSFAGLTLALMGLCYLIVLDTIRDPHPGRIGALVVLLAPWVYLVIRDLYVGQVPNRVAMLYPLVVVACWILRPRVEVLRWLGYLVGLTAILSILIGLALPSKGFLHSVNGGVVSVDKQLLPGGLLIGFLTDGNSVGQILAVGIPLVAIIRRPSHRWVLLGACFLALVWTASRSSMLAVALAIIAAAVLKITVPPLRRFVGPALVLSLFAVVAVLPLVVTDPLAFTNRGNIWAISLNWWRQSPWVGNGANWYSRVGKSSESVAFSVFHAHNEFVQLLVTGGVVLVILVAVMLVAVSIRAGDMAANGQIFAIAYLVALAGSCLLEKAFVIVDRISMFPVFVIPLAILLSGDYGADDRPSGATADEVETQPMST
jgi:O-antigen ligase